MGSVCDEQRHKLHTSHLLQLLNKKSILKEIDIPPRKLLNRRAAAEENIPDMFSDSPRAEEEPVMQKFLPYNCVESDDSDSDDPYSSDHFRIYEFKVRRCTRSRSHDWTDCPFAHPGEKARRRDPRRYHYSGTVCSEFRRGGCGRGDNCEFAHGVFECWLHPARYRTEACKDGKNCKRKVCFFAHSPRQLRLLPLSTDDLPEKKYYRNPNHCCLYCHSPISASPTSTLMGISHMSPPLSPLENHRSVSWVSPISRYGGDRFAAVDSCSPCHKDEVTELMSSVEGMNVSEDSHAMSYNNGKFSWVDVCLNNGDDHHQQQFVLSPSTPSPSGSRGYFSNCDSSSSKSFNIDDKGSDNGLGCPDLGWVNDLLT